jgi:hypothetical protein
MPLRLFRLFAQGCARYPKSILKQLSKRSAQERCYLFKTSLDPAHHVIKDHRGLGLRLEAKIPVVTKHCLARDVIPTCAGLHDEPRRRFVGIGYYVIHSLVSGR